MAMDALQSRLVSISHRYHRALLWLLLLSTVVLFSSHHITVHAFDYSPTPLRKSILAHELIVVAKVVEATETQVKVSVISAIKGKAPPGMITLPGLWRPKTEWSYGPVPLANGGTYLIFLKRRDGKYSLPSDFASKGVTKVKSADAPLVRVVGILYRLSQTKKASGQLQILDAAWKNESDQTKVSLIRDGFYDWKNESTIPFLIEALNSKDYGVAEYAHITIGRHGYRPAIPTLIELLRKNKSAIAARTLGQLKARAAFDALVEASRDEKFPTNRYWVVQALGRLEDKRAIPLLIEQLHWNLREFSQERHNGWYLMGNGYAAEALGKMKTKEAVQPLIQILEKSSHKKLRSKAVRALGMIGPEARDALPVLKGIAENDKDKSDAWYYSKEAIQNIENPK